LCWRKNSAFLWFSAFINQASLGDDYSTWERHEVQRDWRLHQAHNKRAANLGTYNENSAAEMLILDDAVKTRACSFSVFSSVCTKEICAQGVGWASFLLLRKDSRRLPSRGDLITHVLRPPPKPVNTNVLLALSDTAFFRDVTTVERRKDSDTSAKAFQHLPS
jgi:hypothetical protein